MKGFAFPRQFRQSSLAESLSRNMRELTTFVNSFVVRFDSDGSSLSLPGDVSVTGDTTLAGVTAGSLTLGGHNVGVWGSFSPVWEAGGTPVTLGNGTLNGTYTRIGGTVRAHVTLVIGSTTSGYSAAWRFGLPVNADTGFGLVGDWVARDSSDGNRQYTGVFTLTATDEVRGERDGVSGTALTFNTPVAFATGDQVDLRFAYKAA